MKYQCPKIHRFDQFSQAYGTCAAGEQAVPSVSCLTGVNAAGSACNQGVHPERSCTSGTMPANKCVSGSGDSEW